MDVFISWTRTDEAVKNVLAKKLQEAGVSYWDSDLYCTSDFAEECIAAIKRCSVFIAIVSDASMGDGYVQNEITTARDQEKRGMLNILVYKITDAPYTNQFEFLLNHISYVTGNFVQRTSSVTGVSGIDTIVSRAQALLKKRAEGNPEKPYDVHIPEVSGLKLAKTGYFVGGSRDNILTAMEEGFTRSNVLILSEFFGFGKRSVIRKFVECNQKRYSSAVMVRNECGTLREFLIAGLEFTNVNPRAFEQLQAEALLQAKLRFLEKLDARTLLVIPNVQFEGRVDGQLCEMLASLKCHIILLTEKSADGYEDWFPVIQVGRMQDVHLRELFFHHYARAYEEEREALAEPLTRFFANIGGHTKTVELTAAALNHDLGVYPEDVPRYLSMRDDRGLELKDRILEQIGNIFDVDRLRNDELIALLVAACIAVPYASVKNYRAVLEACGVQDWQIVAELDKKRWLDLDNYNRTVSMEPVVAQIVFTKIRGGYFVMNHCLDYLVQHSRNVFSLATSKSVTIHIWGKLAYFLMATGFPECAEILMQLRRGEIEEEAYDTRLMAEAIRQYEAANSTIKSADSGCSEDEPEEDAEDRAEFENMVLAAMGGILPVAKLIAKNVGKLVLDFSTEGSRIMESHLQEIQGSTSLFGVVDYPAEELEEFRTFFQDSLQNAGELDEEELESGVLLESLNVFNAFCNRDHVAMQAGIYNLLESLGRFPEEMFGGDTFDIMLSMFQMICSVYFTSGMYSAAVMICEKILRYPLPAQKRSPVLLLYIKALRQSRQYTPALYAAYDEILKGYDTVAQNVFELRADMLREKKSILLIQAEDLARGERLEEALRQFDAARKLKTKELMDREVLCAQTMVDVLVKSGEFQQAIGFVKQYFPSRVMEELRETGDEQTRKILEEFSIYQSGEHLAGNTFASDGDPRKHVSYYQAFSRKNNGLLEQKYYNVADETLDYDFSDLDDWQIADHAQQLRKRAKKEKMLRLAPEAFALASEAGYRVLGYRHHFVQYMGAAAMAEGKISEILNGEGKTYTILLTAFLHSLYGKRVYVADQSAYLTHRNYQWMSGVYALLGVSHGHITQSKQLMEASQNIIYADMETLVLGYLNYEIHATPDTAKLLLDTVIIDEADTTLVDEADREARIVAPRDSSQMLLRMRLVWLFTLGLPEDEEYYTFQNGQVVLRAAIYPLIEKYWRVSYGDIQQMDMIRELENNIKTAILCHVYYEKDRDYYITNNEPVRENKKKGVFEKFGPETSYFLCRENGLDTSRAEKQLRLRTADITNCICLRDFFKKFQCVCGTTATAVSFREEFREIYGLDCFCVPPHSPVIRKDMQLPVYITRRAKERAILEMILQKTAIRQPLLIITQSTEESERYSRLLRRGGIAHQLLNAKNAEAFSDKIVWAGVSGSVLVTNALAGRGADIKLGGNPELKTRQELVEMGEDVTRLDSFLYCLPTPEQKETPLYQKYYSILEKNKALCAADRQVVVEAGGLCVIGTSFFPEPRTEQQTRGRSGRQGEVGESWVFRSLEDEELQPLLSSSARSWLQASIAGDPNIQDLDSPLLHKAIDKAQKQLHRTRFARIRSVNNDSRYIDEAREDFIGRRFALADGYLAVEESLLAWVRDKTVLQQLQLLQKGEKSCGIVALENLFRKYPELQTAKGVKTSAALLKAVHQELAKRLGDDDQERNEKAQYLLRHFILDAWAEYIGVVTETVTRVNTTEQSLTQFFAKEKQRLARKPVERLLLIRLKEK